ncbi:MAG: transketolase C-terminal domain-containing protein [Spirochaetales bacterium]|nr:transketolase C-terminal domain-containing protein [Spirochaetales bacterium]
MADTRDLREVYKDTLCTLAEEDKKICIVEADLMNATGTPGFKSRFPERAFDVGVAEANMVGVASGLAAAGMIPFAASFGCFAARRAYDQFFLSGNYSGLKVKLVGTDPGVSAIYNGGTHMPFEDIAMMRAVPGLTILEPCDRRSLEELIRQAAYLEGSVYIRLHRKGGLSLYDENTSFEIGKGVVVREGTDLTIIAAGLVLMEEAVKAVEILEQKGISAALIDMHTIKPLDNDLVLEYAGKTGAVLTCENGQAAGGLGGAVAELLCDTKPVPLSRLGVKDEFGQVGTLDYLKEAYGFTAENIVKEAENLVKRK